MKPPALPNSRVDEVGKAAVYTCLRHSYLQDGGHKRSIACENDGSWNQEKLESLQCTGM